MNRTTSTRTRLGIVVAAAAVAGGLLTPAVVSAASAAPSSRVAAASHHTAEADVAAFLARAARLDHSLKGQALAVNRSFRRDGTVVVTAAAQRASQVVGIQLDELQHAFPLAADGVLRERLLRLYADLAGRQAAMSHFGVAGRAFHEYPGRRFHGVDDLARVRVDLAVGHVLAGRYRADVAAVHAQARREGRLPHMSDYSRHSAESGAMQQLVSLIVHGTSEGRWAADWSGIPLVIRWTGTRGTERSGVVHLKGHRSGLTFTVDHSRSDWLLVDLGADGRTHGVIR